LPEVHLRTTAGLGLLPLPTGDELKRALPNNVKCFFNKEMPRYLPDLLKKFLKKFLII
jgi:hypothetical protein